MGLDTTLGVPVEPDVLKINPAESSNGLMGWFVATSSMSFASVWSTNLAETASYTNAFLEAGYRLSTGAGTPPARQTPRIEAAKCRVQATSIPTASRASSPAWQRNLPGVQPLPIGRNTSCRSPYREWPADSNRVSKVRGSSALAVARCGR